MAKKIGSSFIKTASKTQENKIIENAKKVLENPFSILPDCGNKSCRKCYFDGVRNKIKKLFRYADNRDKLEKLSKRKDLIGAIAGVMTIAHSEKAPYLASVSINGKELKYAVRGKADKKKLIALEYINNPLLRLLGIGDIALKKKLHIYSWDKGFVCTGLEGKPPEEFIEFLAGNIGLRKLDDKTFTCAHINKKEESELGCLKIKWMYNGVDFLICKKCATGNTFSKISKYMIEPDQNRSLDVKVMPSIIKSCKNKCSNCVKKDLENLETKFLDEYFRGIISDHELIEKNEKEMIEKIKNMNRRLFILDGNCFGDDPSAFIETLYPNDVEKVSIEFILDKLQTPLIVSNMTPNKLLELFWKDYGLPLLEEILDDKDIAHEFFNRKEKPSDIVSMAYEYKKKQDMLSKLPKYENLSKIASFADNVAKAYKTEGLEKALIILKNKPDDTRAKAIAYAFLLALNKARDKRWQYSDTEAEFGGFLKEYALKLLNSKPEEYHQALQALLSAAGLTETLRKT